MEFENVSMPAETLPEQICAACAAGALFHRPTKTTAAYCVHSMTGAVYPLGGTWGIVRGVEAHYFRDWLVKVLTKGELLGDVAPAVALALIEESKRAIKH